MKSYIILAEEKSIKEKPIQLFNWLNLSEKQNEISRCSVAIITTRDVQAVSVHSLRIQIFTFIKEVL